MTKQLLLVAALAATLPAAVSARTVHGVDFDAVPWETLCPSVESVGLRTSTGSCAVSHPASTKHAKWEDLGTGETEPKPNCARLEKEYRKLTSPKFINGNPSWVSCSNAFSRALNMRALQPWRYEESLDQWRARYFSRWMNGAR
ncbi:MAG: hypothetical protein EOM92_14525 [Gammaproteobacteria bacterium]|nr:hypothetical protein [Gammaproteobacteria bacterium]